MIAAPETAHGTRSPDEREAEPGARARRRFSIGWLVLALGALALAGWIGWRVRAAMKSQAALAAEREQAAAAGAHPAPADGSAVRPTPRRLLPSVPVEGTLAPGREADLAFQLGGRLASVRVRMGDQIKQGAVLATLEQAEAAASLQAATAQVRAAEAQLALADDAERRTSALVATGAQPQAAGIQAQRQRELAAAQADAARAQLALATAALAHHSLTAPFAGHVTRVPSGPGAIVGPGVPLFHLQDLATLRLVGTVGQADAPLLHPGAKVEVRIDGRTVAGTLTAVLASVDAATRRLPVEASVPNDPKAPILAGTFVRATIAGQREIEVLELPASALRPGSQAEVMVIDGTRLRARRVVHTIGDAGELLVRGGLGRDERVLAAPSAEARDGDEVTLR